VSPCVHGGTAAKCLEALTSSLLSPMMERRSEWPKMTQPMPRSTSSSGAISPVYAPTPRAQLFCAAIWYGGFRLSFT